MRQVPYPHYLIIGNGRIAKHFIYYFSQLQLSFSAWSRAENNAKQLQESLSASSHILLLIKDDAIDHFIQENRLLDYPHCTLIHFSAGLNSKYAYLAHPLYTFSPDLYSLSDYVKIPIIIDEHAPPFQQLLPGLNNPHHRINSTDKAYYHALCVIANNFTTLLWQKYFTDMEKKFRIPLTDLKPFLMQTLKNISNNPETALTGPIQRKDKKTMQRNLQALKDDKFLEIYKAFVNVFLEEKHYEKCE